MADRRLNTAQRVVIVIAFGFSLYLFGSWVTSLGEHLPYRSAMYTNVSAPDFGGGLHLWVRMTIWFLVLALWLGVSVRMLRSRPSTQ